jgi:hypothetical protein
MQWRFSPTTLHSNNGPQPCYGYTDGYVTDVCPTGREGVRRSHYGAAPQWMIECI